MFSKLRSAVSNMVASGWDHVAVGREADALDAGTSQVTSSSATNQRTSAVRNGPGVRSSPPKDNGSLNRKLKYPYSRPEFLLLGSDDEVQVAGDHQVRPIIVPRDMNKLPWNSGYAEAVNAGKSSKNEDQAAFYCGHLHRDNGRLVRQIDEWAGTRPDELQENMFIQTLPYYYMAVFDGHAGSGAAVVASKQLHHILHTRLLDIVDHILPPLIKDDELRHELHAATHGSASNPKLGDPAVRNYWLGFDKPIETEKLIVGALEAAFWEMDQIIGEERVKYRINGGCTALVALFILGRLYVANAGDSRAVLVRNDGKVVPMSHDFTPESERTRVQKVAAANPELLGAEYTHLDFYKRPIRRDIGQRVLYRDAYMTGYAYKTVTQEDLKYPVVYGEGKRSRVLATIGVTRGFGDHDLKAQNSRLLVKPFLTPEPEVMIFDLEETRENGMVECVVNENDVLILGTDGLWDITSNEKAGEIVVKNLTQFPEDDQARFRYRYTSAAQDLVMSSRGKLTERNWRLSDGSPATIDDITAFVIPLAPYYKEHKKWVEEDGALREFFNAWKKSVVQQVATGVASTRQSVVKPAALTKRKSEDGMLDEEKKEDREQEASIPVSPQLSPSLPLPTGRLAILENGVQDDEEDKLLAVVSGLADAGFDSDDRSPSAEDDPVDER